MRMIIFLQEKFERLRINIKATEGSISDEDYNKIKEIFTQLGIEVIEG